MSNELKAKKLIKRIEKLSSDFWLENAHGIDHRNWCAFYFNMMRAGEALKKLGVKYNPRSKRYPCEFIGLFK